MSRILLVGLVLITSACVPVRVVETSKRLSSTANGRTYKTYNLGDLDMKSQPFGNYSRNLTFVSNAIDNEMKAKGFEKAAVNPDIVINLGLAVTEEVQTRETTIRDAPYNFKYSAAGPTGRSYSWQAEEIEVARYHEGNLALDFVDREKNEMVWQGSVAGTLVKDDKKMEKRINEAMRLLFRRFPLKAN